MHHIIRDDSDFGLEHVGDSSSIEAAEKYIQEYCRPGYIYHICQVVKTVKFKFDPTLEEIK